MGMSMVYDDWCFVLTKGELLCVFVHVNQGRNAFRTSLADNFAMVRMRRMASSRSSRMAIATRLLTDWVGPGVS